MTDQANVRTMPNRPSSTSQDRSLPTLRANVNPGSITDAVALLTSCLALVKPVGMSQDDTQAWLRVAAGEVKHLPTDILASACADARKTCTHHGQIIPAILKEANERLTLRHKINGPAPLPPERQIEHHRWAPTREELEALKADAARNLKA